jgi:two-component system CheB/CheR fusion protein
MEKPVGREELLARIDRVLVEARDRNRPSAMHADAARRFATLTPRQRQVLELVLAGRANKNIAAELGISQRSVENHRAAIMRRTGTRSLAALARFALAASGGADGSQSSAGGV